MKQREPAYNAVQTPDVYIMHRASWDRPNLFFDSQEDSRTQRPTNYFDDSEKAQEEL